MQVVLNIEKESMPEENFMNLLKVIEDTPIKVLLCNPDIKFNGDGNLGNHVNMTKAKACMDLNEKYNIPAMSIDVDMELNEDIFIPWFEGHKNTPFNFIQHPLTLDKAPPFLRLENSLVYYNYSSDKPLRERIQKLYSDICKGHTGAPNLTYLQQCERLFEK